MAQIALYLDAKQLIMRLESKKGIIPESPEKVYHFLINFDNFKHLIPADKVSDWKSEGDTCSFTVQPLGKTGIRIVEKEPFKLIKLSNLEQTSYNFFLWIQFKETEEKHTATKLTMEIELNPMLQMLAKGPLQNFLDTLVDQLGKIKYS